MGKPNIFEITFTNFDGVFYPGSVVVGHVTVELVEPMEMRGITLSFSGKATTRVTRGGKNTTTYTAEEEYFEHTDLLFGTRDEGSNLSELPRGRHTFPFQFELPNGLPPSFETYAGYIRYQAICRIDKYKKSDHKTKRLFTVVTIHDLNLLDGCEAPTQFSDDKYVCCCCCQSGPITGHFHVKRRGWVPGEAIKLFADITNNTNRVVNESYVALMMETTVTVRTMSSSKSEEVARVNRPPIYAHEEDSWTGEELVIPPLPPSSLVGCNSIDVKYSLELHVCPAGAIDLVVPLQITIGTVPLRYVVDQVPPMMPEAPPHNQSHGNSLDQSETKFENPTPYIPDIPNLPPPSYLECITGRVNIIESGDSHDMYGNHSFAPAYIYYNWGHTPQPLPDH